MYIYISKAETNSTCFVKLKTKNELFMRKIANEPAAMASRIYFDGDMTYNNHVACLSNRKRTSRE